MQVNTVKVLHCIYSLSGGGAEKQLSILSENGQDHDICSVTFCVDANSMACENGRTVKVYNRKRKYDLGIFTELYRIIEKEKPDIVHAWLPPYMTVPALIVSRIKNIPTIFSYRNRMKISGILEIIEYLVVFLLSSGIVSNINSKHCSFPYRLLFRRKNGVLIRNSIRSVENKSQNKSLVVDHGSVFNLLFVGRIVPQKNWERLLRALTLMGDKIPWRLCICGRGHEHRKLLKSIENHEFGNRIKYIGFSDNISEIMVQSDLLIVPSLHEGMSNVVVEAFSMGLPAVISNIDTHSDLVGDSKATVMFDPKSPEKLADVVIRLFRNPEILERMVIDGMNIAELHTVERMSSAYREYYRFILTKYNNNMNTVGM